MRSLSPTPYRTMDCLPHMLVHTMTMAQECMRSGNIATLKLMVVVAIATTV